MNVQHSFSAGVQRGKIVQSQAASVQHLTLVVVKNR